MFPAAGAAVVFVVAGTGLTAARVVVGVVGAGAVVVALPVLGARPGAVVAAVVVGFGAAGPFVVGLATVVDPVVDGNADVVAVVGA